MSSGTGPTLTAYRVETDVDTPLVVAPRSRSWIEETTSHFAKRCLPLLIANQAGWFILNSHGVRITWDGRDAPDGLSVDRLAGDPPYAVGSHFGHGIVTWKFPYVFRTSPGWNLLVRGPANWPKDGASPLEGIVETDWAVATFTMNWKITRVDLPVVFELGEPICMIVPQRRAELESFQTRVADGASDVDLQNGYQQWVRSRGRFIHELGVPETEAWRRGWQKHYFRGTSPSGHSAVEHQSKIVLQPFIGQAKRGGFSMTSSQSHQDRPPEIMAYVRKITAYGKYPLENFGHLLQALGGENASYEFQGKKGKVSDLRHMIPEYYFPVLSEEDLLLKIDDLRSAKGSQQRPSEPKGKHQDFPDFRLPDVSKLERPTHVGIGIVKHGE
jgi:hypothetical protein